MPDLRALPALSDPMPVGSSHVRLSPLPEGTVLQVVSGPGASDQTAHIERVAAGAGLAIRPLSPGQWLLVGDLPTRHTDLLKLLDALEPHASGIDQSHGRVRMRLEGPMATSVLSKGTAIDLDATVFPAGQTAATLIGHISAHLTRLDVEVFELAVLRGFAAALWDELARMSEEFV